MQAFLRPPKTPLLRFPFQPSRLPRIVARTYAMPNQSIPSVSFPYASTFMRKVCSSPHSLADSSSAFSSTINHSSSKTSASSMENGSKRNQAKPLKLMVSPDTSLSSEIVAKTKSRSVYRKSHWHLPGMLERGCRQCHQRRCRSFQIIPQDHASRAVTHA